MRAEIWSSIFKAFNVERFGTSKIDLIPTPRQCLLMFFLKRWFCCFFFLFFFFFFVFFCFVLFFVCLFIFFFFFFFCFVLFFVCLFIFLFFSLFFVFHVCPYGCSLKGFFMFFPVCSWCLWIFVFGGYCLALWLPCRGRGAGYFAFLLFVAYLLSVMVYSLFLLVALVGYVVWLCHLGLDSDSKSTCCEVYVSITCI